MSETISKARRGFLALIGTAPIAAPVAMKEAAARMGIGAAANGGSMLGAAVMCAPPNAISDRSWIQECIAKLSSPRRQKEFEDNARYQARLGLDPDLASMRSISPSFAYRQQVDRCRVRIEASERQYLLWQLD